MQLLQPLMFFPLEPCKTASFSYFSSQLKCPLLRDFPWTPFLKASVPYYFLLQSLVSYLHSNLSLYFFCNNHFLLLCLLDLSSLVCLLFWDVSFIKVGTTFHLWLCFQHLAQWLAPSKHSIKFAAWPNEWIHMSLSEFQIHDRWEYALTAPLLVILSATNMRGDVALPFYGYHFLVSIRHTSSLFFLLHFSSASLSHMFNLAYRIY